MEYEEAVRRRRMVRSFSGHPVDHALVERLLELSLRAPSAGNTGGTAWVVLADADTAIYWDLATTADWRETSRRFPGLSRAPVIAVCLASPDLYAARYREPDKADSGLGTRQTGVAGGTGTGGGSGGGYGARGGGFAEGDSFGEDGNFAAAGSSWPVPYWFGDAAFTVLLVLLGATDAGLGACFLGSFRAEAALLNGLGVPPGWRVFGAVLLGEPDGDDHPSRSLARRRPTAGERIHHGRWSPEPPVPA